MGPQDSVWTHRLALDSRRVVLDVVILGVGARSHVGLDALQTTLATRANKMRVRESHMIDRQGEPIGTCRLESISDAVQGLPRFVALAVPPLVQATFAWRKLLSARGPIPPLPVVIALPTTERPGFDRRLLRDLFPWLQHQSGIVLDPRSSLTVEQDRGGGVLAFIRAIEILEEGLSDVVAVGGVDSYFDPDVLESLDAELRLHALATENGFIPGEGAGFLLLARRSRATGFAKLGKILGVAVEDEPRPWGADEPCQGLGMSAAIRRAAGSMARGRHIPWALTDVANERHRVDEWQIAQGRCFQAFSPELRHDQPLLKTGDVGAASAAMLAAMACVHWAIGSAPGDLALVATHSDGPERGALLLGATEESGGALP